MKKFTYYILLTMTFVGLTVLAERIIDADKIMSSDRTKTWNMPITAGTLPTLTSVGTFTNKVISGGTNTIIDIPLSALSPISSSQLSGLLTDESGSGLAVFSTNGTLTGPLLNSPQISNGTFTNALLNGSTISNGTLNNPIISGASISTSTLSSPIISGASISTSTLSAPVINGGSIASGTLSTPLFSDALTITQTATPASPAISKNKIYIKSDDKLYVLNSAGIEKSTGGLSAWAASTPYVVGDVVTYSKYTYICIVANTSGSTFEADASKWVITNNPLINENLAVNGFNFEDNDIGGWSALSIASGTNGLPVTVGTGGAALSSVNGGTTKPANLNNPSISTTSGTINGQYSLNFSSTGTFANYAGYVSPVYIVSPKYQAKVLTAELSFKVASGTFVMGGTSADSMAIAVYDTINNAWLGNDRNFSFNQSSGVGTVQTSFQTATNTTGIQLYIYSPNSPTGTPSLVIDDIGIYNKTPTNGAVVLDAKPYTPIYTGIGTVSSSSAYWSRIGDRLKVWGTVTSGVSTAAAFTISLPTGLAIDSSKIGTNGQQRVGWLVTAQGVVNIPSVSAGPWVLFTDLSGSTGLVYLSNVNNSNSFTKTNGNAVVSNGNTISFDFEVPIVSWSSSTIMSADASTMAVTANIALTTGVAVALDSVIKFDTQLFAEGISYSASTGLFTILTPGKYLFSPTTTADGAASIYYKKNGVAGAYLYVQTANAPTSGNIILNMVAGDTFGLYTDTARNFASASGVRYSSFISTQRISGPSQIAASETISALYTGSPPTGTLTSAFNIITYGTKIKDSHNAYSGGVYTVPASGTYSISAAINNTGTYVLNNAAIVSIFIDGIEAYRKAQTAYSGTSNGLNPLVTVHSIPLLAGQLVTIRAFNNGTSPAWASSNENWFSITRTGNY